MYLILPKLIPNGFNKTSALSMYTGGRNIISPYSKWAMLYNVYHKCDSFLRGKITHI